MPNHKDFLGINFTFVTDKRLQQNLFDMNKVSLKLNEMQVFKEKERKQEIQAKIVETEKIKRCENTTMLDLIYLASN